MSIAIWVIVVVLIALLVGQGLSQSGGKRELIRFAQNGQRLHEAASERWENERTQLVERIQESNYTRVGYERLEVLLAREREQMAVERREWTMERQKLLDRIQAPTFDHLKHHEVKVIKAQSGVKDPPLLDPL